jgi:hypothetical protein
MSAKGASLFRCLLGPAWYQLAIPIRQLHEVTAASSYSGRCTIRRGQHPLAQLIARGSGFPDAGSDTSIILKMIPRGTGERWVRIFNKRILSSVLTPGRGRYQGLVRERIGPVSIAMALVVDGHCLRYVVRAWTLFGVPMPLTWSPQTQALESIEDGQFKFDVTISHPLTGMIVHYTGILRAL